MVPPTLKMWPWMCLAITLLLETVYGHLIGFIGRSIDVYLICSVAYCIAHLNSINKAVMEGTLFPLR